MAKIEILRIGTPPLVLLKELKIQFISIRDAIQVLGDETRDMMRQKIEETLVRDSSTGNLQSHINTFTEGRKDNPIDSFVVGIGSVDELNHFAPYWFLMNYGGFSTIAARGGTLFGQFSGSKTGNIFPDSSFAGTTPVNGGVQKDRFTSLGQGGFPMTPKSPVAPKNYIEKTSNWLNTVWRVHMSGKIRKVQTFQNNTIAKVI